MVGVAYSSYNYYTKEKDLGILISHEPKKL